MPGTSSRSVKSLKKSSSGRTTTSSLRRVHLPVNRSGSLLNPKVAWLPKLVNSNIPWKLIEPKRAEADALRFKFCKLCTSIPSSNFIKPVIKSVSDKARMLLEHNVKVDVLEMLQAKLTDLQEQALPADDQWIEVINPKQLNRLHSDASVHETLDRWWQLLPRDEDGLMPMDVFHRIVLNIYSVLIPGTRNSVVNKAAQGDFDAISLGQSTLSCDCLVLYLFELAAIWAPASDSEGLVTFLRQLFQDVFFNPEEYIPPDSENDGLEALDLVLPVPEVTHEPAVTSPTLDFEQAAAASPKSLPSERPSSRQTSQRLLLQSPIACSCAMHDSARRSQSSVRRQPAYASKIVRDIFGDMDSSHTVDPDSLWVDAAEKQLVAREKRPRTPSPTLVRFASADESRAKERRSSSKAAKENPEDGKATKASSEIVKASSSHVLHPTSRRDPAAPLSSAITRVKPGVVSAPTISLIPTPHSISHVLSCPSPLSRMPPHSRGLSAPPPPKKVSYPLERAILSRLAIAYKSTETPPMQALEVLDMVERGQIPAALVDEFFPELPGPTLLKIKTLRTSFESTDDQWNGKHELIFRPQHRHPDHLHHRSQPLQLPEVPSPTSVVSQSPRAVVKHEGAGPTSTVAASQAQYIIEQSRSTHPNPEANDDPLLKPKQPPATSRGPARLPPLGGPHEDKATSATVPGSDGDPGGQVAFPAVGDCGGTVSCPERMVSTVPLGGNDSGRAEERNRNDAELELSGGPGPETLDSHAAASEQALFDKRYGVLLRMNTARNELERRMSAHVPGANHHAGRRGPRASAQGSAAVRLMDNDVLRRLVHQRDMGGAHRDHQHGSLL